MQRSLPQTHHLTINAASPVVWPLCTHEMASLVYLCIICTHMSCHATTWYAFCNQPIDTKCLVYCHSKLVLLFVWHGGPKAARGGMLLLQGKGTFHSTQRYSGNTRPRPPSPPCPRYSKNGRQPCKNMWHRVKHCYSSNGWTPDPPLFYPSNIRCRETFPNPSMCQFLQKHQDNVTNTTQTAATQR